MRTSFGLHVQLKAIRIPSVERDGHYSFGLPLHQYNRLRDTRRANPRILVVLYLPQDRNEWLQHSEDGTIFRRCAYWVSLRGAKASDNDRSQTVYVPRKQLLSPETLTDLMTRCSRDEEIDYAA